MEVKSVVADTNTKQATCDQMRHIPLSLLCCTSRFIPYIVAIHGQKCLTKYVTQLLFHTPLVDLGDGKLREQASSNDDPGVGVKQAIGIYPYQINGVNVSILCQ